MCKNQIKQTVRTKPHLARESYKEKLPRLASRSTRRPDMKSNKNTTLHPFFLLPSVLIFCVKAGAHATTREDKRSRAKGSPLLLSWLLLASHLPEKVCEQEIIHNKKTYHKTHTRTHTTEKSVTPPASPPLGQIFFSRPKQHRPTKSTVGVLSTLLSHQPTCCPRSSSPTTP